MKKGLQYLACAIIVSGLVCCSNTDSANGNQSSNTKANDMQNETQNIPMTGAGDEVLGKGQNQKQQ